jgi:hypothetical protein
MLRFYAVECALKALLMRREHKHTTQQLGLKSEEGHDIRKLAQRLKLPGSQITALDGISRRKLAKGMEYAPQKVQQKQRNVSSTRLHEVWRYGATLEDEDQKRMDTAMNSLLGWARQEPGL